MNHKGNVFLVVVILLLAFSTLAFGSYYVYNREHKSLDASVSSGGGSSAKSSTYATLSPATVPSKVATCTQVINYGSNGVPSPITCSNGDINQTEWEALAALEPQVLTLGYDASANQVQSTICSDVKTNISNSIEEVVYQIAAKYYGWSFVSSPDSVLSNGTCQNVDD